MTTLDINDYDLVISNFALQWVDDLWITLKDFYNKSYTFAFSTLLSGTFQEWQNIVSKYSNIYLNHYPTEQEIINYCNNIKNNGTFSFWIKDISIKFDRPLSFIHYLKNLGASASPSTKMPVSALRALAKENNKLFTTSYKIFFGILKKAK